MRCAILLSAQTITQGRRGFFRGHEARTKKVPSCALSKRHFAARHRRLRSPAGRIPGALSHRRNLELPGAVVRLLERSRRAVDRSRAPRTLRLAHLAFPRVRSHAQSSALVRHRERPVRFLRRRRYARKPSIRNVSRRNGAKANGSIAPCPRRPVAPRKWHRRRRAARDARSSCGALRTARRGLAATTRLSRTVVRWPRRLRDARETASPERNSRSYRREFFRHAHFDRDLRARQAGAGVNFLSLARAGRHAHTHPHRGRTSHGKCSSRAIFRITLVLRFFRANQISFREQPSHPEGNRSAKT